MNVYLNDSEGEPRDESLDAVNVEGDPDIGWMVVGDGVASGIVESDQHETATVIPHCQTHTNDLRLTLRCTWVKPSLYLGQRAIHEGSGQAPR